MSGIFGRLSGLDGARKEMRERTDDVLSNMESLKKGLSRNTRILGDLMKKGFSGQIASELKTNIEVVVKAEKDLDKSLHEHIAAMESIVNRI